MTIMTIKLITGEELVGSVDTDNDEYLIVDNPMLVDYFYDQLNGFGMKMSPYMPTVKDKLFTFSKKHVIVLSETEAESSSYYERCASNKPETLDSSSLLTEDSPPIDKKKLN